MYSTVCDQRDPDPQVAGESLVLDTLPAANKAPALKAAICITSFRVGVFVILDQCVPSMPL